MLQRSGDLRLQQESLAARRIPRERVLDLLQRDVAAHLRVAGQENLSQATAGVFLDDLVTTHAVPCFMANRLPAGKTRLERFAPLRGLGRGRQLLEAPQNALGLRVDLRQPTAHRLRRQEARQCLEKVTVVLLQELLADRIDGVFPHGVKLAVAFQQVSQRHRLVLDPPPKRRNDLRFREEAQPSGDDPEEDGPVHLLA